MWTSEGFVRQLASPMTPDESDARAKKRNHPGRSPAHIRLRLTVLIDVARRVIAETDKQREIER